MSRLRHVLVAAVCALVYLPAHAQADPQLPRLIEAELAASTFDATVQRLYARESLRRAYLGRDFEPLWIDSHGVLAHAAEFIEWLETVPGAHGLHGQDYHLDALISRRGGSTAELVKIELALSDAFLVAGSHLLAGRVNGETLEAQWTDSRYQQELLPLLGRVGAATSPGALLEGLLPSHPDYRALVEALQALRDVQRAGGWPRLDPGPTLRAGDSGSRVAQLVERLRSSGDLRSASGDVFTDEVTAAVKRFQLRHGLAADGLVGRVTLTALNRSVDARIEQIVVNLERWRWLPEDLGDRYVIVNTAAFRLDAVEHGVPVLGMRVVVGLPYRRTPVFSDQIRYLVLNPNWDVPPRIAVTDKLPLIKAHPGYLSEEGYQLLRGSGASEQVVDPLTVDWSRVDARNFPFRLRQTPGPFNALGRIKFMFPNKFSVYLHDTPSRSLFAEDTRAFSSGCIRVEAPFDLAELLLRDDPDWPRARIEQAAAEDMQQTVWLRQPMPIHILYWTAWIDRSSGTLNFADDLYGRDEPLLRALLEPPPH